MVLLINFILYNGFIINSYYSLNKIIDLLNLFVIKIAQKYFCSKDYDFHIMKKNITTLINENNCKEKCSGSGFLNMISKNTRSCIWIFIFLGLFSSRLRFDAAISFISASLSVGTMVLLDQIIRRVLIPKYLSNNRHQIHYYMASFIIVYLMIWGSVSTERFLIYELIKLKIIHVEIGRASCRERVLRLAYISGV